MTLQALTFCEFASRSETYFKHTEGGHMEVESPHTSVDMGSCLNYISSALYINTQTSVGCFDFKVYAEQRTRAQMVTSRGCHVKIFGDI